MPKLFANSTKEVLYLEREYIFVYIAIIKIVYYYWII